MVLFIYRICYSVMLSDVRDLLKTAEDDLSDSVQAALNASEQQSVPGAILILKAFEAIASIHETFEALLCKVDDINSRNTMDMTDLKKTLDLADYKRTEQNIFNNSRISEPSILRNDIYDEKLEAIESDIRSLTASLRGHQQNWTESQRSIRALKTNFTSLEKKCEQLDQKMSILPSETEFRKFREERLELNENFRKTIQKVSSFSSKISDISSSTDILSKKVAKIEEMEEKHPFSSKSVAQVDLLQASMTQIKKEVDVLDGIQKKHQVQIKRITQTQNLFLDQVDSLQKHHQQIMNSVRATPTSPMRSYSSPVSVREISALTAAIQKTFSPNGLSFSPNQNSINSIAARTSILYNNSNQQHDEQHIEGDSGEYIEEENSISHRKNTSHPPHTMFKLQSSKSRSKLQSKSNNHLVSSNSGSRSSLILKQAQAATASSTRIGTTPPSHQRVHQLSTANLPASPMAGRSLSSSSLPVRSPAPSSRDRGSLLSKANKRSPVESISSAMPVSQATRLHDTRKVKVKGGKRGEAEMLTSLFVASKKEQQLRNATSKEAQENGYGIQWEGDAEGTMDNDLVTKSITLRLDRLEAVLGSSHSSSSLGDALKGTGSKNTIVSDSDRENKTNSNGNKHDGAVIPISSLPLHVLASSLIQSANHQQVSSQQTNNNYIQETNQQINSLAVQRSQSVHQQVVLSKSPSAVSSDSKPFIANAHINSSSSISLPTVNSMHHILLSASPVRTPPKSGSHSSSITPTRQQQFNSSSIDMPVLLGEIIRPNYHAASTVKSPNTKQIIETLEAPSVDLQDHKDSQLKSKFTEETKKVKIEKQGAESEFVVHPPPTSSVLMKPHSLQSLLHHNASTVPHAQSNSLMSTPNANMNSVSPTTGDKQIALSPQYPQTALLLRSPVKSVPRIGSAHAQGVYPAMHQATTTTLGGSMMNSPSTIFVQPVASFMSPTPPTIKPESGSKLLQNDDEVSIIDRERKPPHNQLNEGTCAPCFGEDNTEESNSNSNNKDKNRSRYAINSSNAAIKLPAPLLSPQHGSQQQSMIMHHRLVQEGSPIPSRHSPQLLVFSPNHLSYNHPTNSPFYQSETVVRPTTQESLNSYYNNNSNNNNNNTHLISHNGMLIARKPLSTLSPLSPSVSSNSQLLQNSSYLNNNNNSLYQNKNGMNMIPAASSRPNSAVTTLSPPPPHILQQQQQPLYQTTSVIPLNHFPILPQRAFTIHNHNLNDMMNSNNNSNNSLLHHLSNGPISLSQSPPTAPVVSMSPLHNKSGSLFNPHAHAAVSPRDNLANAFIMAANNNNIQHYNLPSVSHHALIMQHQSNYLLPLQQQVVNGGELSFRPQSTGRSEQQPDIQHAGVTTQVRNQEDMTVGINGREDKLKLSSPIQLHRGQLQQGHLGSPGIHGGRLPTFEDSDED